MSEEQDARLEMASQVLQLRIAQAVGGRNVTQHTVDVVSAIVKDHIAAARRAGLDFPAVVVLPFPRQQFLKIVNADLDRDSIRTLIVNLAVEVPDVTQQEIAAAIRYAFPTYRPDDMRLH